MSLWRLDVYVSGRVDGDLVVEETELDVALGVRRWRRKQRVKRVGVDVVAQDLLAR
jgi:hypothetical protein